MNMNNVSVKIDVSINGAQVVPTAAQLMQIHKAVTSIVFKASFEELAPHSKGTKGRPLGSRNKKKRINWSDEELQTTLALKQEGKSHKRIAAIINSMFHTGRTTHAVGVIMAKIKRGERKGVGTSVLERVARVNEFNNQPQVSSRTIPEPENEFQI